MDPSVSEPTVQRIDTLPISELSWERFEQFGHDLVSCLDDMREETAHRYGTQGQAQGGIDVIVQDKTNKTWGFSNKRYKNYQPNHVQKHIAETTYAADRYVILISGIASPSVRDEISKHPNWELWDADDLSQKVRLAVSHEKAKRVVDHHFGPRWRKQFLGLPAVGAFLPATDYFAPFLDTKRLFHHSIPLIGRKEVVAELLRIGDAPSNKITILPGRGGIGKSRILREFAAQYDASHPERALRLLNEGIPVTLEALDDLPPVPCQVVVDDAHRIPDLRLLLAWLREHPDAKLLLSTRPQGVDLVGTELTRAGFDPTQIKFLPELGELPKAEVKELADSVLGPEFKALADRLVRVSRDCPLVTVVGGRLLTERAVAPELLEQDGDFRQAVLNRFRDEMLGKISDVVPPDICQRLLELISALTPVPADNIPFLARVATFMNAPVSQVVKAIGEMENLGLLIRRGNFLRIVPDLLADHILTCGCINARGISTGLAHEIYIAFVDVSLSTLLRNLAELDWRIRATTEKASQVLDLLWSDIEGRFRQGGHANRVELLHQLRECAYFVPKRILELVRLAFKLPSSAPPEEVVPGWLSYSHSAVMAEIPELLHRCSFSESCSAECLEFLWEMQENCNDSDATANADTAFRVLEGIAEYAPSKPLRVQRTVITAVRRWISQPGAFERKHSPLDVLDGLLAKSGHESWTEDHKFFSNPFLIDAQKVQEVREEVLALLKVCTKGNDISIVLRAIRSLNVGLQDPRPIFGMEVSDEALASWEGEQLLILRMLDELLATKPEPLVVLEVLRLVRHTARYGRLATVRLRAKALIDSIEHNFDLRITRMLLPNMSQWDDFLEFEEDSDEQADLLTQQQQLHRALAESVATDMWSRFSNISDLVSELGRRLAELKSRNQDCSASNLVDWLLKRRPEVVPDFTDELIRRQSSQLADCLTVALAHYRDISAEMSTRVAITTFETASVELRKAVATFCRWKLRGDAALAVGDVDLIKRLLFDSMADNRRCGLSTLKWLARFQPRDAIELALATEVGNDNVTAGELCQLGNAEFGGIPNEFSIADWSELLRKLRDVKHIDHRIASFLRTAYVVDGDQVMRWLLNRVERVEKEPYDSTFRMPSPVELTSVFGEEGATESTLASIRDASVGRTEAALGSLAELFKVASHNYGEVGWSVLKPWIVSGSQEEVKAAVALLRGAGRELPFQHFEDIVILLERANSFGSECKADVEHRLEHLLAMGLKQGIWGQPFQADVWLRDQCRQAIDKLAVGSSSVEFFQKLLHRAESNIQEVIDQADSE